MKRDTIDPGLLRMLACVPFVLLGVVLIAFQVGKEDGKAQKPAQIPSVAVKGTTYVITSVFEGSSECPEGFAYTGETAVSGSDDLKPYYINPERPEWVYIYQECRDQQTQEPYMGYVRYVEEVLRWVTLLRYQGEVYIFLNDTYYLPYQTEVAPSDQARYDAVPYDSVLRELPEGFQPVGKTVSDGCDLVPTSELGSNKLPGQQVLANPEEPDLLLLRNYSSGPEGPEYWVFVRFQDESTEALEREAQGETVLLSDLISKPAASCTSHTPWNLITTEWVDAQKDDSASNGHYEKEIVWALCKDCGTPFFYETGEERTVKPSIINSVKKTPEERMEEAVFVAVK